VLQNEKYIEFADDNTVEVLALGELQSGIDKGDRRAETYDGKDEKGNPVKYLKEFAGCTVEQLNALNSSPANQYNKTGHIPYVCLVDPWTQKQITPIAAVSVGGIGKAVAEARVALNKEHGPSVKRSTLRQVEAGVKAIEDLLAKNDLAKALPEFNKLKTSLAKEGEGLKSKLKPAEEKVLELAKTQLDDAEAKLAAGEIKPAEKIVNALASGLKGTDLETRVKDLQAKIKAAGQPTK
jgi:hypothetical protein